MGFIFRHVGRTPLPSRNEPGSSRSILKPNNLATPLTPPFDAASIIKVLPIAVDHPEIMRELTLAVPGKRNPMKQVKLSHPILIPSTQMFSEISALLQGLCRARVGRGPKDINDDPARTVQCIGPVVPIAFLPAVAIGARGVLIVIKSLLFVSAILLGINRL